MSNEDYASVLKQSGLKFTGQRAAVLAVLESGAQPMTADAIFSALTADGVSINLSTVYRTLETLTQSKVLNKVSIAADNKARYEFNRKVHRHFLVCTDCRRIRTIEHCPLEEYEQKLAAQTDFRIEGHRLDVYGLCPECVTKKGK